MFLVILVCACVFKLGRPSLLIPSDTLGSAQLSQFNRSEAVGASVPNHSRGSHKVLSLAAG